VLVDRARLIDLLAWACASLLVIWVFIVGSSHGLGKISAADVIGDLLLTGVALRLVVAVGRNPSAKLLLAGAAGMLVGDVVYPLAPSHLTETGFVVLYVCWGLAALHPSMTGLTQPMPPRLTPWKGRWAVLLGISVATPAGGPALRGDLRPVRDGVVIAVAGGITLTLSITRLADSVNLSGQALNRERGSAHGQRGPGGGGRPARGRRGGPAAAVGQLMPASSVHKIVFAADDPPAHCRGAAGHRCPGREVGQPQLVARGLAERRGHPGLSVVAGAAGRGPPRRRRPGPDGPPRRTDDGPRRARGAGRARPRWPSTGSAWSRPSAAATATSICARSSATPPT